MKKLTWATSKSLFGQIATSSCLVAVSAGVIFGVSANTFKVEYLDLDNAQARLKAAVEHNYSSQNIISQWNMYQKGKPGESGYIKGVDQPTSNKVTTEWWNKVHPGTTRLDQKYNNIDPNDFDLDSPEGTLSAKAEAARSKYAALVIDGSTHTALDRSFNQGLYNGIANFNKNKKHDVIDDSEGLVFKPSQDSTQEFVNIYRAVAAKTRVLSLAGFNHVTPLNALGKQTSEGIYEFSDKNIANAGMMLMDGDVTNNQNIASVLFRSDQPAFLSAIATCMYFYNNLHLYHDRYQDMTVAAYGGTAIPTVIIYMGGFQRGIEFFNHFILKDSIIKGCTQQYIMNKEESGYWEGTKFFISNILPATKYKDEVEELRKEQAAGPKEDFEQRVDALADKLYAEFSIKMIKLGDFGTHFSGSFAAGDAIGISKQLLNRGASAIIAVAGPQSLDTAQEVMNQNSKTIVIGVDSAMERSDYQKPFKSGAYKDKTVAPDQTTPAQASNIIKFSAVKDMTNVSDKMLRLAASGKHWDVNNDKPWLSPATLPAYTEDEVVSDLAYIIEPHEADGCFDINGFDETQHLQQKHHVMRLPLHITTESGKTLQLRNVYGFKAMYEASSGNLSVVDTLCFGGQFGEQQTVTFGNPDISKQDDPAFDYTWTREDKNPGIKYIDFSNIPAGRVGTTSDENPAFKNMVRSESESDSWQNGIIKFRSIDTESEKSSIYHGLFGEDSTQSKNWAIVEPDPYSSICSFGFKTCGNIENGLISISEDGWPQLFKALTLINVSGGGGTPVAFGGIWLGYGRDYCEAHQSELPQSFIDLFDNNDLNAFITFNKENPLYKYYAHTMAILGYTLKNTSLQFEQGMTVVLDEDGNPYLPDYSVPMSIIDWLKCNMYFTI